MERSPEDLSGALRKLESEYVSTGMDPANEDLLRREVERLKGLRGPDGRMVFEDKLPQLRRVAAINVGVALRVNRPKTA